MESPNELLGQSQEKEKIGIELSEGFDIEKEIDKERSFLEKFKDKIKGQAKGAVAALLLVTSLAACNMDKEKSNVDKVRIISSTSTTEQLAKEYQEADSKKFKEAFDNLLQNAPPRNAGKEEKHQYYLKIFNEFGKLLMIGEEKQIDILYSFLNTPNLRKDNPYLYEGIKQLIVLYWKMSKEAQGFPGDSVPRPENFSAIYERVENYMQDMDTLDEFRQEQEIEYQNFLKEDKQDLEVILNELKDLISSIKDFKIESPADRIDFSNMCFQRLRDFVRKGPTAEEKKLRFFALKYALEDNKEFQEKIESNKILKDQWRAIIGHFDSVFFYKYLGSAQKGN